MDRDKCQMEVGKVACLAPGWDLSRQPKPSIDDRIGKVAIEAMDALIGEMLAGREDADLLLSLDRIVQNYIAARRHIAQGHGK